MSKLMPLTIDIHSGVLRIRIGVRTLAHAVEQGVVQPFGPLCGIESKILNFDLFAKDVLHELEREAEDGTTPVHSLLDKAAYEAINNGSEWVRCKDDDSDEPKP